MAPFSGPKNATQKVKANSWPSLFASRFWVQKTAPKKVTPQIHTRVFGAVLVDGATVVCEKKFGWNIRALNGVLAS
jgi:hypothetical protein